MKPLLLILGLLLFTSLSLFAEDIPTETHPALRIISVDKEKGLFKILIPKEIKAEEGTRIIIRDDDDSCSVVIYEIKRSVALASSATCPFADKIEVGVQVEKIIPPEDLNADKNEELKNEAKIIKKPKEIVAEKRKKRAKKRRRKKYKVDSWYTYWGLGTGSVSYGGTYSNLTSSLEAVDYTRAVPMVFDIFGFYVPFPYSKRQTLIGGVIRSTFDIYAASDSTVKITNHMISLSGMHFFGKKVGKDFFLRGDIGLSKYSIGIDGTNAADTKQSSGMGVGILMGGGYSWYINELVSLLFTASFSHASAGDLASSSVAFTIGGLF